MKTLVVFVTLLYVSQHASAVETYAGEESVLLPCYLPTFDLSKPSLVWSRSDLLPPTVHQRQPDGDKLIDQNQDYRGRTSMQTDALRTGDLSLTLRRPTTRDSGSYTCILRDGGQEQRQSQVTLQVKGRPVIWFYIVIGVFGLLLSLPVVLLVFKLYEWKRNVGGHLRGSEILFMVFMVPLIAAAAVVYGAFILYEGINTGPPPDWVTGLMGLLIILMFLGCGGSVGVVVYEEMKNTGGRLRVRVQVLLVLLGLLVAAAVVLCSVILYKGIKNTEVSWHGDTVEVYSGRSVLLPCEVSPLPKNPTVTWSRHDLRPLNVHQRKQLGDDLRDQSQVYSSRTSMKTDALTTGDLSLTLINLQLSDSSNYTCIISAFGNERTLRNIELKVEENYSATVEVFILCGILVLLSVPLGVVWWLEIHKWRFIKRGRPVEVEEGAESAQLPFKTTPQLSEDVKVEWTDKNNRKVHVYEDSSKEQNQLYRGRTEMKKNLLRTGDLSLILKHLRVRDGGKYICRVYNKDRHVLMRKQVTLLVTANQVEVKEGVESVQLPFKAEGLSEDVRVVWTDKNNMEVHVYENGSEEQDQVYRGRTEMKKNLLLTTGDLSLTLKHPTVRNRGDYTCNVYNKDGDFLRGTVVTLKVKVQKVEVEVEEGAESVQLSFQTTSDLSQDVRVEWRDRADRKVNVYENGFKKQHQVYRGRTEMNEDLLTTGDLSVTLKHLTVKDAGDYTCRVYNKDGDILKEKIVTLKFKDRQVEVEEGAGSVQLPFKITSDLSEDVKVEWTDREKKKVHVYEDSSEEQDQVYRGRTEMNEDLMRTGDLSLILKHPTERDRGDYTCRVYNKDGNILREKTVTLKVKDQKVEVEVEEGAESVQLPFKITSDLSEDVRVEWTDRDNMKVHVYENGHREQDQVYRGRTEMNEDLLRTGDLSLMLKRPTVRDRGDYTCSVYNKDGDFLRGTVVPLRVKGRTQVRAEERKRNRSCSVDPPHLMAVASV